MAARDRHPMVTPRRSHIALSSWSSRQSKFQHWSISGDLMACRIDQSSSAMRNHKRLPELLLRPCYFISEQHARVAVCPLNELEVSQFGAAS